MTQKNKELLLRDLCGRLQHNVVVHQNGSKYDAHTVAINIEEQYATLQFHSDDKLRLNINVEYIKPYLRPMSSMTEEEHQVCREFKHDIMTQGYGAIELYVTHYINWLDKKHFDWRRTGNNKTLIEAGLALEAPEGMYKIK